jgi:hypothetical protein
MGGVHGRDDPMGEENPSEEKRGIAHLDRRSEAVMYTRLSRVTTSL